VGVVFLAGCAKNYSNLTHGKMGIKTIIGLGVVVLLMAGALFFVPTKEAVAPEVPVKEAPGADISLEEKARIDAWIKAEDLNQFGDPKDLAYLGGTPLFNESTGESTDRYEYILNNYPDRPWLE